MSKKLQSFLALSAFLPLALPALVSADAVSGSTPTADMLFSAAGYASLTFFLVATVLLFYAANLFRKTAMYAVLLYFAIGTGMIVAQSAFIALGAQFFGIEDASLDVWWHFLFFLAFAFHFYGLYLLTQLGVAEVDADPEARANRARLWGFLGLCFAVFEFLVPRALENVMQIYTKSPLDSFGLHHFIAFIFAGVVFWYLFFAQKNLGQLGRLIANPVIFALVALSLQHLWELLTESWKVIVVHPDVGEGVEKIFLIAGACSLIWGAWKLISFSRATSAPAPAATPTSM
jgi:hypothetical protein